MAIKLEEVHLHLVEAVPEFGPVLQDALEFTEGDILPYYFLLEFLHFVEESLANSAVELVDRAIASVDHCLTSGDDEVVNLISVQFVEQVLFFEPYPLMKAKWEDWPPALKSNADEWIANLPG